MNKAVLQIWEQSVIDDGIRQDGCSIHLDLDLRNKYVNKFYSRRLSKSVPIKYIKAVGDPVNIYVTDQVFNVLNTKKDIRLMQNELNNLVLLQDIMVKE